MHMHVGAFVCHALRNPHCEPTQQLRDIQNNRKALLKEQGARSHHARGGA